jgi:hypothetical protein
MNASDGGSGFSLIQADSLVRIQEPKVGGALSAGVLGTPGSAKRVRTMPVSIRAAVAIMWRLNIPFSETPNVEFVVPYLQLKYIPRV